MNWRQAKYPKIQRLFEQRVRDILKKTGELTVSFVRHPRKLQRFDLHLRNVTRCASHSTLRLIPLEVHLIPPH